MKRIAFFGSVALIVSAQAQLGPVVYDNGAPTHQVGYNVTRWRRGEAIKIAAPTTIAGVTFWSCDHNTQFDGLVEWRFYSGHPRFPFPDAVLAGGVANVSRSDTGFVVPDNYIERKYTFSLPTPFNATRGTVYYFTLKLNPTLPWTGPPHYWVTTNQNGTQNFVSQLDGVQPWEQEKAELAFQLHGPLQRPEPEALDWASLLVHPVYLR